nr:ribosomal protein S5 [Tanacetum cinerariifolium]
MKASNTVQTILKLAALKNVKSKTSTQYSESCFPGFECDKNSQRCAREIRTGGRGVIFAMMMWESTHEELVLTSS